VTELEQKREREMGGGKGELDRGGEDRKGREKVAQKAKIYYEFPFCVSYCIKRVNKK